MHFERQLDNGLELLLGNGVVVDLLHLLARLARNHFVTARVQKGDMPVLLDAQCILLVIKKILV